MFYLLGSLRCAVQSSITSPEQLWSAPWKAGKDWISNRQENCLLSKVQVPKSTALETSRAWLKKQISTPGPSDEAADVADFELLPIITVYINYILSLKKKIFGGGGGTTFLYSRSNIWDVGPFGTPYDAGRVEMMTVAILKG